MPHHIKPMLTTLVAGPFDRSGWIFEIKWDGFRCLAEIRKNKVEIYSRNLISFNDRFEPIMKALKGIKKEAVLDGEIVVLDSEGKSRFQLLQNYLNNGDKARLIYYVFDILYVHGQDLRRTPLLERKKILKNVLSGLAGIKYSDHIRDRGVAFFKLAEKKRLEGIVAKDGASLYHAGRRTRDWLKIKIRQQQEAVIGGFTQPRGSRKKLGALVLGVYKRGKLIYIGHTGGGFNEKSLDLVYKKLKPLSQKQSPFLTVPKTNAPVTWVKPRLVCEVTFEEWTGDGHMRQPIFLGLRPDKKANEVHRELPS